MNDEIDKAIASPHWEACHTCRFLGENGCIKSHIELSVHFGDLILCEDYEMEEK